MLQILPYTDPRLREVCARVEDPKHLDIRALAHAMFQTIEIAGGAGLAAPQVGYGLRLFVMAEGLNQRGVPASMRFSRGNVFINPTLVDHSEETILAPEGCLSMPGVFYDVPRFAKIEVTYDTLDGEVCTRSLGGKEAVCAQHEMDHLDGILAISRLSRLKRERAEKKFAEQVKMRAQLARQIRPASTAVRQQTAVSPTANFGSM